jgi:hypothetical protein
LPCEDPADGDLSALFHQNLDRGKTELKAGSRDVVLEESGEMWSCPMMRGLEWPNSEGLMRKMAKKSPNY